MRSERHACEQPSLLLNIKAPLHLRYRRLRLCMGALLRSMGACCTCGPPARMPGCAAPRRSA